MVVTSSTSDSQTAPVHHKVKAASPQDQKKAINASLRKEKQQHQTGPSYENPRPYRPSGNADTHMVDMQAPGLLKPAGNSTPKAPVQESGETTTSKMPSQESEGIITTSYQQYCQGLASGNLNSPDKPDDGPDSGEDQLQKLSVATVPTGDLGDSSRLGLSRCRTPPADTKKDSTAWTVAKGRDRRGKSTPSTTTFTSPCKVITDTFCGIPESKTSDSDVTYVASPQNSTDSDNRFAPLEDEDDDLELDTGASTLDDPGSAENNTATDGQDFQSPGSS